MDFFWYFGEGRAKKIKWEGREGRGRERKGETRVLQKSGSDMQARTRLHSSWVAGSELPTSLRNPEGPWRPKLGLWLLPRLSNKFLAEYSTWRPSEPNWNALKKNRFFFSFLIGGRLRNQAQADKRGKFETQISFKVGRQSFISAGDSFLRNRFDSRNLSEKTVQARGKLSATSNSIEWRIAGFVLRTIKQPVESAFFSLLRSLIINYIIELINFFLYFRPDDFLTDNFSSSRRGVISRQVQVQGNQSISREPENPGSKVNDRLGPWDGLSKLSLGFSI